MKLFMCLFLPTVSNFLSAHEEYGIERVNFFPETQNFLRLHYRYSLLNRETPRTTIQTKEVNNYANTFSLSYGRKIHERVFLGLTGIFEKASENGVSYGVPTRSRFDSHGLQEPEVFFTWRIKEQDEERGLWDLRLSYSDSFGAREVGEDNANRLNGRNILKGTLSHGYWEEPWEFRTTLQVTYLDEGEEINEFTDMNHDLDSTVDFSFTFQGQYQVGEDFFLNAMIGANYFGSQDIKGRSNGLREIQPGSGSIFGVGGKVKLTSLTVLEAGVSYTRNNYFIKGDFDNLEGLAQQRNFFAQLTQGF